MTPVQVKAKYGATHYITMEDKVTPQMYYKIDTDRTIKYLSFAGIWFRSDRNDNPKRIEELAQEWVEIN